MLRRSNRVRKAPVPIYTPDPNTVFEDDYTDYSDEYEGGGGFMSSDFDDDESDEESIDSELNDPNVQLTKDGYLYDDFIAGTDSVDEMSDGFSSSSEEEEEEEEEEDDEDETSEFSEFSTDSD